MPLWIQLYQQLAIVVKNWRSRGELPQQLFYFMHLPCCSFSCCCFLSSPPFPSNANCRCPATDHSRWQDLAEGYGEGRYGILILFSKISALQAAWWKLKSCPVRHLHLADFDGRACLCSITKQMGKPVSNKV